MERPVYLDYNATTPVDPEVAEAMRPFIDNEYGNPSSHHYYGARAKKAVELAREQVAMLLNCFPDEVVFTGGGTESNNLALKGAAFENRRRGNQIITSTVEHPAVTEVCRFLESQGFNVTWLPVDEYGMVSPTELEKAISPSTILISVMHANNETGTIQPVAEIGGIARKHNILFHTDAAQSTGKIEIDLKGTGIGLLSIAGHKFYAPKGVGALFIRRGIKLQKLLHGASHEQNLRAGTENVAFIVGLGKAAEIAIRDFDSSTGNMKKTRDRLHALLKEGVPGIRLNGHPDLRLPNTLSLGFPGVEANTLLDEMEGIAASAGAACHADNIELSPVLSAMGVPPEYAMGTVRFSTGKFTTMNDVEKAAPAIIEAVKRIMPGKEGHLSEEDGKGPVRLTRFTHGLGCACKIRPQYLEKVLRDLPAPFDKNVIVGAGTSDDAAVYRISDDIAIVQTVDFFTPVVDDPYDFGAIAAANALSDIYAMGAVPLFALNIVGFPDNRLPVKVLKDILRGATDKAAEAGINILGGHTVEDTEPKFGMAVTGTVHPGKVITNSGARPGDVLILTKPIGTGIISTAVKRGIAPEGSSAKAVEIMKSLNATAADVMKDFPVNACTDITGFGLMGHLKEMVVASAVSVLLDANKVPLIEGTSQLAAAGAIPGGTRNNLDFVSDVARWDRSISETMKLILCDAQTSGGLLISLPGEYARDFISRLEGNHNIAGVEIGSVTDEKPPNISVRSSG